MWQEEEMMNLWDQIKSIPYGAVHAVELIGEDGHLPSPEVAQSRADICNGQNPDCKRCFNNDLGFAIAAPVASAIKALLQFKARFNLRVKGEKQLGLCSGCGCSIRLLVWQPSDKVKRELSDEEKQKIPEWCWKLNP